MTIPICEHIKPGGMRCGSPAMRDHSFCYYHVELRRAVPTTTLFVEQTPLKKNSDPYAIFNLPFLEDAAGVQIGFMQLIEGVAHERLDPKRARLILSALHGAAANLRLLNQEMRAVPGPKKPVGSAMKTPMAVSRKRV